MTTVFIAVQCCECSTMQVKQQKKTSNKWTCVVCNQKQSVRKVFAQGFMARDVRKFVQSFNMSRQFADQQQQHILDETLDPLPEDTSNQQPQSNYQKRRTDWSEYIDPIDNHHGQVEDEQEDEFEPEVVTELPEALFKKPKLKNYSREDGGKGFRPVFSKRNSNKDKEPRKFQPTTAKKASKVNDFQSQGEEGIHIPVDKEQRKSLATMTKGDSKWRTYATSEKEYGFSESRQFHSTTANGSSKWSEFINENENEGIADKVPGTCYQPRMMNGVSKWDNYITDDDDHIADLLLKNRRGFADQTCQWDDGIFEATLNGERVEDDIHPDFL